MLNKYIYKNTKNNFKITIKYPEQRDALLMCKYINKLSREKTYITLQGEHIALEDEEKYVQSQILKFNNGKAVQLLLYCNDKLIGISGVEMHNKIKSHIGGMGISIDKDFRNMGFGKILMENILEVAKKKLKNLKIVTLEVFGENKAAIHMYKGFGFIEYGRLPMGNKYKGKYVEDVLMYKQLDK